MNTAEISIATSQLELNGIDTLQDDYTIDWYAIQVGPGAVKSTLGFQRRVCD